MKTLGLLPGGRESKRKRQIPFGLWRLHHDNLAVSRILHLRPRSRLDLQLAPSISSPAVPSTNFRLPSAFQSLALLSIDARLSSDPNLLRFRQLPPDLRRSSIFGATFHFRAACAALPLSAAAFNLLPASTGHQSPAPSSADLRLASGNQLPLVPSTDLRPASILRIRLCFPANSRLAPRFGSFPLYLLLRTTHCGFIR